MELKSVEDTSWLQLFIKNSRFPLVSATHTVLGALGSSPAWVPLLPKLRGYFAEFLDHS